MTIVLKEPSSEGMSVLYDISEVYVKERSPYQEILIAETVTYGRTLFLDNLIQSAEADEALYHEPLVHPALVLHPNPRRVLVGGTGEGASLRELLRHASVERVLSIDLDPQVVEACREHMPTWHAGAFDDPRVELRFEDVQDTLANARASEFDVVIMDITDPVESGPSVDLFTTRFYRAVHEVLSDDGIFVLQSGELCPLTLRTARTVRSTLLDVFPFVRFLHLHVPSFQSLWSLALATKRELIIDPPDLEQRVARLPREDLRTYTPTAHRAMFELPPFLDRLLREPGRVVTGDDDDRLIAYRRES